MKFGKTYSALIYDPKFPPEWRERAINYRQLKKLINQVVVELQTLGLNPDILRSVLEADVRAVGPTSPREVDPFGSIPPSSALAPNIIVTEDESLFYEVSESADVTLHLSPRLRRRLSDHLEVMSPHPKANGDVTLLPPSHSPSDSESDFSYAENEATVDTPPPTLMESSLDLRVDNPLWELQRRGTTKVDTETAPSRSREDVKTAPEPITAQLTLSNLHHDLVIPLPLDSAFFQLLASAVESLTSLYKATLNNCSAEVESLTDSISSSAHPSSQGKSDLYAWREIFQTWVEAEIFESLSERTRGERSVDESEQRLSKFANHMVKRGLADGGKTFRLKTSKNAMKRFLALNVLILDMKKFQLANAEATRKILKKHEKRTSLPSASNALVPGLNLRVKGGTSLPHVLLVLITNTLLPVIPSIEDYTCLICTSVAFKPIRLACGHLFCVRCLAKMQKRQDPRHAYCALCRAPTVFEADANNLDRALMNFLKDWFPKEVKVKVHENEREIAYEMAEDLGYAAPGGSAGRGGECCIM